jgi:hypothetical protein
MQTLCHVSFRYYVPVYMRITNSDAYEILASCCHITGDIYTTDASQQQVYIMNTADVKC